MLVSGGYVKVSVRVRAAWSDQFKQVVAINSFQGPWKRGHIHQSNGSLYMNETIEIQNSKFFVQGKQNYQIKYAIFTYLS